MALLNKYGAQICTQCGTQLPAPNEYIITTLQPPKGMQQLDQRIKRIQTNNIRDGYVKKRQDVEKEITQRQTGCSGGSAPVPPQPQQPSSQQQQAGHARQVPDSVQPAGNLIQQGQSFVTSAEGN